VIFNSVPLWPLDFLYQDEMDVSSVGRAILVLVLAAAVAAQHMATAVATQFLRLKRARKAAIRRAVTKRKILWNEELDEWRNSGSDRFRQMFRVSEQVVDDVLVPALDKVPGLVSKRPQAHQLPLKLRILSAIYALSHTGSACDHARVLGIADDMRRRPGFLASHV
jgi:hypothetical protein